MNEKTRQLVRDLLAVAHLGALASVQERVERLPLESRRSAMAAMADCQICVYQLFEGLLSQEEAEARLVSHMHGHPDPEVVDLLQSYAETLQLLLADSRRNLLSPGRSREN
jgi:hypothetical protein